MTKEGDVWLNNEGEWAMGVGFLREDEGMVTICFFRIAYCCHVFFFN